MIKLVCFGIGVLVGVVAVGVIALVIAEKEYKEQELLYFDAKDGGWHEYRKN